MKTPKFNEEYAELFAHSNIHYTPAWYWQRFPGFLNVECYRILANWTGGLPDDDEEPEEETLLKKRKVEDILSK